MSQKEPESGWKEQTGLSDDRTYARLYPTEEQKATWKQEAEDQGFSSLSKYLLHQINDARTRQILGEPPGAENREIEELENRIAELESKLEQERQKNAGNKGISDPDILKKFLSPEPKPLPELMQGIVESGVLDEFVRKRVEDQLYFMSQHDDVIYDRQGGGWRLPRGGDS